MKKDIVIIGSVTYAIKAKELLFSKGIRSYIERTKKTKEYGCGYSLYIPNDFEKAVNILKEHNIKVIKVLEKGDI